MALTVSPLKPSIFAMSAPRSHRVRTTSRGPSGPCDSTAIVCHTRCSQNAPGATLRVTSRNASDARVQSIVLMALLTSWSLAAKSAANRAALLEQPRSFIRSA
jgi:hypothetical protein